MARRVLGDNDGPAHPAKDSEPSSYFSLSEAVPSTLRSHSGSMDVTDVAYAPRLEAFSRRGETLLEDRATPPPTTTPRTTTPPRTRAAPSPDRAT
ncbi:unnamed protein product [Ectocarpus fasciculatus]